MARKKNFQYGELWDGMPKLPEYDKHGRYQQDIAKYTTNHAFINFVKDNGYSFFIDYDLGAQGQIAFTDVTHKEIVVNANYCDEMITAFIQHELGHLMLFNVNQFTTIKNDTLRSIISKVIYTSQNLSDYGIEQLFFAENVIQDIFIETLSNGRCVCQTSFNNYGENIAVKHLDTLEDAKTIAREACKTVLKSCDENPLGTSSEALNDLLDSMLKDLEQDIEDIKEEQEKTKTSRDFENEQEWRRQKERSKIAKQIEKLDKQIERQESRNNPNYDSIDKKERLKEKLKKQLDDVNSQERKNQDKEQAKKNRQNRLNNLQKKLEKAEDIKKKLEESKQEGSGNDKGKSPEQNEPGNSNGEQSDGSGNSPVTSKLHKNTTDHLAGDEDTGTGGHSYDCGLPHPVTIEREESYRNERNFLKLDTSSHIKKIEIQEDDAYNVLSNKNKISESEFTYFRSSKKEIDETDMMKGKRKLRASGINVLVGLDISGSMVNEWTKMFSQLSEMVENFQDVLDIENIIYFTYNHKLREASDDLDDLTLKASGGNAFAYVYQEMMQRLPMMQCNEIILVTDCGDNLGFPLKDVVVAERHGTEIKNHITIVDTENAGFYDVSGISDEEWSLYRYDDPNLTSNIEQNISDLIDY